jgi:hypothetical protein
VESVEHLLDAGIALDVEERVGLTVARQELLDPKRSRGLARTDEDFTNAALNQLDPPQNERPEEELGELTVGLQNLKEAVAVELLHACRLGRTHAKEPGAPRQHVDLAGELSGTEDREELLAGAGCPDEFRLTLLEHEEAGRRNAGFDERFAGRE